MDCFFAWCVRVCLTWYYLTELPALSVSAWGFSGLTGKMSQSVSNKYCVDVSGDNLDREHEEQGRHQPAAHSPASRQMDW